MNILVTGSNGQLGNELQILSKQKRDEDTYFFTDVNDLDITNSLAVNNFIKNNNIDVVINCAAYTNVDKAEEDKELADKINNIAVGNLADGCKNKTLFIHVSTDYVFGGDGNIPYKEDNPISPVGIYGHTKYLGEQQAVNSGCNYIIFRTAWLYSSFGNNFVKTMLRLTKEKESLGVVFDQAGTPTYARDLAQAIFTTVNERKYKLLSKDGKIGEIFHYSNEGVCSWFDFAWEINNLSNHKCIVKPLHSNEFPSKATRPAYSVLDKTKIKEKLNLDIPYWKNSLQDCINNLNKL